MTGWTIEYTSFAAILNQTRHNLSDPFNHSGDPQTSSQEISTLRKFSLWYQGVHGYAAIVVCLFGIITNITNIIVLTRRKMISPTNHILTALAVADVLTMTSYLTYATYFHIISVPDEKYGHNMFWVAYLLFNIHFTITTHTVAMWLTVALALFRYIVVCHNHVLGLRLCSLYRAKITVLAVFLTTPVVCIPNYIQNSLAKDPITGNWWVQDSAFVSDFYKKFNFWLFGVVLKVAPCVLLAVLSTLLIRAMHVAHEARRRLKSRDKLSSQGVSTSPEHIRTTAMLVAVVLCFVVAELPQGILAFLSGIDNKFFSNVYVPLGDVWDMLGLLNSCVNFLLYCTMSRQFRETFSEVATTAYSLMRCRQTSTYHLASTTATQMMS